MDIEFDKKLFIPFTIRVTHPYDAAVLLSLVNHSGLIRAIQDAIKDAEDEGLQAYEFDAEGIRKAICRAFPADNAPYHRLHSRIHEAVVSSKNKFKLKIKVPNEN
jgi:hypothetical protein